MAVSTRLPPIHVANAGPEKVNVTVEDWASSPPTLDAVANLKISVLRSASSMLAITRPVEGGETDCHETKRK